MIHKKNQPKKITKQVNMSNSTRQQWISVAAYYMAEKNNFDQNKNLSHWLAAEIEFENFQIRSFLLLSIEDGGMSICNLQKLAESLGVTNAIQKKTEIVLVREIQKAMHHRPCFKSTYQEAVDPDFDCPWRKECHQLRAIWYR